MSKQSSLVKIIS